MMELLKRKASLLFAICIATLSACSEEGDGTSATAEPTGVVKAANVDTERLLV